MVHHAGWWGLAGQGRQHHMRCRGSATQCGFRCCWAEAPAATEWAETKHPPFTGLRSEWDWTDDSAFSVTRAQCLNAFASWSKVWGMASSRGYLVLFPKSEPEGEGIRGVFGLMLVLQIREGEIPSAAGGWRIRDTRGCWPAALWRHSGRPASASHAACFCFFPFLRPAKSVSRSCPTVRSWGVRSAWQPIRRFRPCFVSCYNIPRFTPPSRVFGELEKQSGSKWEP